MITKTLQLARECFTRGDHAEAELACQQVLSVDSDNVDALKLSGIAAINSGNFLHAIQRLTQVVTQLPDSAVDRYNLGLAYNNAGDSNSAVQQFRKSIDIQPNLACAYGDLCLALNRCGKIEEAISAGEIAVSLLPENPVAHYNLAQAYDAICRYESAIKHYQRAADLFPDHHGIQMSLARAHLGFGNLEQAEVCYRKVIKLYPKDVEPYRQLARLSKFTSPDHEDVKKLKKLLLEPWLSNEDKASLLSALGKVYQDCELYDDAFSYFEQANHIQEQVNVFDHGVFAEYITSMKQVTTREFISDKSRLGNNSKVPVFIVGVPRSGTSLVEQILSSHNDVFGAGELLWIGKAASSLHANLQTAVHYPGCINGLTKSNISKIAEGYLKHLNTLSGSESRVTDKMPNNFLHLGLIHILFPEAKIIHCRRDPRDTCVSMYTENFPDGGVPFSNNLLKLGAYYSQYERIMEHWRTVIPVHSMLEVNYEDLIFSQESTSRRLLSFIDLPWDEACLTFYQKQRRVDTASDIQVIKPMYSSSIGRWKNYQKHLQPLEQGFKYRSKVANK